MTVRLLCSDQLAPYRAELVALERKRSYPLDRRTRFRIDHGVDYSRFARALGAPRFVLAFDRAQRVTGVAAAVRRDGWWYLCDLKTDPQAGNRRVLVQLLRGLWRATDGLAPGAYFVAMDDPAQGKGRSGIARLLSGRGQSPRFEVAGRQRIYLLANPLPASHRCWASFSGSRRLYPGGQVEIRSLSGVKDLLLLPTDRALALAHLSVQATSPEAHLAGILAGMRIAADAGATHLCWALDRQFTATERLLADRGWSTSAGATTYYHAPAGVRWPGLKIRSDQI